jgi:hypothetical protein
MKLFWMTVVAAVGVAFCGCRRQSTPSADGRQPFRGARNEPLTITGCLQPGDRLGSPVLILTSSTTRAPVGTSSAAVSAGAAYILEGDLTELRTHLGQQLEVVGDVDKTVSVPESSIRTGPLTAYRSVANESAGGTAGATVPNGSGGATAPAAASGAPASVAASATMTGAGGGRSAGHASLSSTGGSLRGTQGASTTGVPTGQGSAAMGSTGTAGAVVANVPAGATTESARGTAMSSVAASGTMTRAGGGRAMGTSSLNSSGSVRILLVDSVRMLSSSCPAR